MLKINSLKQSGDTIVEVLIVLGVLAFSLGTSYAIVNKSNSGMRDNTERYQATLYANGQADLIKQYASGNRGSLNGVIAATQVRCLNISAPVVSTVNKGQAPCFKDDIYQISVKCTMGWPTMTTTSSTCSGTDRFNQYTITVTWDSIKGGQNNVQVDYAN